MRNPHPKTEHLAATQWRKGQSGNPRGKPTGVVSLTSRLKEALSKHPEDVEAVIKAWIRRAKAGSIPHISLMIDRVDGSMRQRVDLALYSSAFGEEERRELDELLQRNAEVLVR